MKKISLVITLVICSQLLSAQDFVAKHISNKLTLDYELNWGVVFDGDYKGDGVIDNLKKTKYFNTLNVSYKVASRVSISLGYGFHSQKGENSFHSDLAINEEAKFTGTEFQFAVNLFSRQQRAPLGNHFTIFLNSQSYESKKDDYLRLSGDDFAINLTSIGIGYNYVWVMNEKLPLYLKYGLSVSYPIITNIDTPEYTNSRFFESEPTYQPLEIVEHYEFRNLFRANVGIGWAF